MGLFFLAFSLPALLGLADREMEPRRTRFRGRAGDFCAHGGRLCSGSGAGEHAQARAMLENTRVTSAPLRGWGRALPINPFRWHAILETRGFFQTAEVNTHTGAIDSEPADRRGSTSPMRPRDRGRQADVPGAGVPGWGTWRWSRDVGQQPVPGVDPPQLRPPVWTTVEFTDLRFAYAFIQRGQARPLSGLSGWVLHRRRPRRSGGRQWASASRSRIGTRD